MDGSSVDHIVLNGFTLFQDSLDVFDIGLQNVVSKIQFIKKNQDGTFMVAFPIDWDVDEGTFDAHLKNPREFLLGYTIHTPPLYDSVRDTELAALAKTHCIAKFDLGNFVAIVRQRLAKHDEPVSNTSEISTGLEQLLDKAKAANIVPPADIDQCIADASNALAQKRARVSWTIAKSKAEREGYDGGGRS